MKLCYQVATPDVAVDESVTAYQGCIEETFGAIARNGYDGVELMTLDPSALDRVSIKRTAQELGLSVDLVCIGVVFGQIKLSFTDPDPGVRAEAVRRVNRQNFRLMMDTFHLNIEVPDLFEAIRTYSSYSIHIHLSDKNRRYPGNCGMDFDRVIPGRKNNCRIRTFLV